MKELPLIACTLTPDDRVSRRDEWRAVLLGARRESLGPGAARVTVDADREDPLRRLVALEAECCSFLEMRVERRGVEVMLEVRAPAEAQPVIDALLG